MSKTDKAPFHILREYDAWVVNGVLVKAKVRNALIPPAREAIAEQIADVDDFPIQLPGLKLLGDWRELMRHDDARREAQRNRELRNPRPVIQHHAPKRQPVTITSGVGGHGRPSEAQLPRIGASQGKHTANFDFETPTLMQLANARAARLGMSA